MDMRVILIHCLLCSFVFALQFNVISSQNRNGAYRSQMGQNKILSGVNVSNKDRVGIPRNELKTNVVPKSNPKKQVRNKPVVQIIPASPPNQQSQQNKLAVDVYPPVNVLEDIKNKIDLKIGKSTPITQDMMFQKVPVYKMPLPPRKQKVIPLPPPPFVPPPDEYEGEDNEPLFIRNRNGVMVGAGIGGSFDRLWVLGSDRNQKFFDSALSYYFRLGYQHYFKKFLGARIYANLGDWSNRFLESFFDQNRFVELKSQMSFNYSFFAEILYDFVVLENHSFGIFGGLGIGVFYGEFQSGDTKILKEYFAMPALSLGFAYTLYENNRFEFETKIPLRSGILQESWRTELSTWMIGVSYTYIF